MSEKLFYAIAVDEQLLLQQSEESGDLGGVVQLDEGDFLVFDEVGVLSCCKKSDFCEYFVHVDGRGSYVYKQIKEYICKDNDSDEDSKEMSADDLVDGNRTSKLSSISHDDVKLLHPPDAVSLVLNSENASKWIQKTTTLAFPVRKEICLWKKSNGIGKLCKYEGNTGDLFVIHICGYIEMIVSESLFRQHYRYIGEDDAGDGFEAMTNDIIDKASCIKLRDNMEDKNEHQLEVRRLYPVLAKQMTVPFLTSSCVRPSQCGEIEEFLVQFMSADRSESMSTVDNMSEYAISETTNATSAILLQFALSTKQMNNIFLRMEDEKNLDEESSVVDNVPDYNFNPADVFLPHYKCWEGVIYKRTKLTRQWKAVYATLYPSKIVMGKDVAIVGDQDQIIPNSCKVTSQTIHFAFCSVHEAAIDGRECLFLDNVRINEVLDTGKPLPPYSSVKKTVARRRDRVINFLSKVTSSSHDKEMIPNCNGIYFASIKPSLETFSTLFNGAILHARRDMAFATAQNGNCPRVVEIISSLSPDHAISLLRSQCPVGSSSGILIQHQAAQTCSDLLKVLFPVDEQSPTTLPPSIISELDILDYSLSGLNTLHYAARANNMEVVKYLLQHKQFGLSCDTVSQDGKTALHLARSGEMVGFLLDNGASLVATDDDGNTPLMSLLSSGMNDSVTTFLNYVDGLRQNGDTRANIDVNMESWKTGLSSLSCAIRAMNANTFEIVERLVTIGADPNATDLKSNSCLHEAVLAYITLSRGLMFGEESARDLCAVCVKVMKALVCHGADVTVVNDKEQSPFLLLCSEPGCYTLGSEIEEIVNILTSSSEGSDGENKMLDRFLNCRGKDGWYPLHHVVRSNNSALLECLAEKGANVNVKSLNGNTPFDLVQDAINGVRSCSLSEDVVGSMQGKMRCLEVLNKHKAWRRHRRDQEVETDQSDIKFISSSLHVGHYEVKSATLPTMIKRLCNELFYDDMEAEAVVLSFQEWKRCRCTEVLELILSNYPSASDQASQLEEIRNDNEEDSVDTNHSRQISRESSFLSRSKRGSGFFDARENSPGGLLLLLRTWFEHNPNSLGKYQLLLLSLVLS